MAPEQSGDLVRVLVWDQSHVEACQRPGGYGGLATSRRIGITQAGNRQNRPEGRALGHRVTRLAPAGRDTEVGRHRGVGHSVTAKITPLHRAYLACARVKTRDGDATVAIVQAGDNRA